MRVIFYIYNSPQSPNIGENSDGVISNFRISGQSFTKENCNNCRTKNVIDMKLGPATKFDKRNTPFLKNLLMTSCRQSLTSLSFFQFMANLE